MRLDLEEEAARCRWRCVQPRECCGRSSGAALQPVNVERLNDPLSRTALVAASVLSVAAAYGYGWEPEEDRHVDERPALAVRRTASARPR